MAKPIPIQNKDGTFAGSIGTGKTDIPTASDISPATPVFDPTPPQFSVPDTVDSIHAVFRAIAASREAEQEAGNRPPLWNGDLSNTPTPPHVFDTTRRYVVKRPARERSWWNNHGTSGTSFESTLHREDCRYVRQAATELVSRPLGVQGVAVPDLYLYAYDVPEKICKVCMPDYHEYVESVAGERWDRRRVERERRQFSSKHSQWVQEAIANGEVTVSY